MNKISNYKPHKPSTALLISPTLLRITIGAVYILMLVSFFYNIFNNGDIAASWFNLGAFTLVSIPAVLFAKRYYQQTAICVLCFYIAVGLIEVTISSGWNRDAFIFLTIWPVLVAAFVAGRQGLVITSSWTILIYISLYALSSMKVIGNNLDGSYSQAEIGSAFVIMLAFVILLLIYVTLRIEQIVDRES